ncbi:PA containing protein [Amycolatopsis antarctica]|uniref:PA containing protein n=1 Tax=Amycolatopsis antarctica TaxID=1854586 RepID=A0A263DBX8_9PSEU|nr:PA containing protein [Amycolatopsis antarctica]OZM75006.1 PA containing protein [Amycolatopsis antarctica]
MTTDNQIAAPSFDRMRNMLVRAAEVRESEQQQIFDSLDDIYARLAPVDSLGAVRKRLSELPDRTEVGVLAERLDEAMSRLEAQDNAIAAVARAVDTIVDKLAKPFAQLDGRLDGMAGRFEGVAGRMDGLEDKLQNIHRRLDELDVHLDKQDSKADSLPHAVHGPVRERIDVAETALRERVEALETDVRTRIEELDTATRERLDSTDSGVRTAVREASEAIDATERLDGVADRIEQATTRIEDLSTRVDKVEGAVTGKLTDLDNAVKKALTSVQGTIDNQPDTESLTSVVRKSNEESERRIGGQLDEAMATFAELMLGGGPLQQPPMPTQQPVRQPRRARNGRAPKSADGKSKNAESNGDGSED